MKRFLTGLFLACSLCCTVRAQQYSFLTLQTTTGSEQSFAANGLKITFSGGQALFTSQGVTTTLPLSALATMQFTATATGIATLNEAQPVSVAINGGRVVVSNAKDATVSVTTLDGRTVGTTNLPRGLYLVRVGSQTFKVWAK